MDRLLKTTNQQLKFVAYNSPEYNQAAQLRYHLFYQEHGIPFAAIFDSDEWQALHLVITASPADHVLAYGQLCQLTLHEFQISQMVVEPAYQRHGLGRCVLETLAETAAQRGASLLTLNARLAKVQFYQRSGFAAVGEVFASPITGVLHIKMQKQILP